MIDFSTAIEKLNACKRSGQGEALDDIVLDLELYVLNVDSWPSEFFHSLVRLLSDQDFLRIRDSWKLTYFIQNNWEQLSEEQRKDIRSTLASSFDRYADWMGAFVTAEILGERYGDEQALETLIELTMTSKGEARALVPHGLEALAKTTQDDSIRGIAVQKLRELAHNENEDVRLESEISLKKLGHKA